MPRSFGYLGGRNGHVNGEAPASGPRVGVPTLEVVMAALGAAGTAVVPRARSAAVSMCRRWAAAAAVRTKTAPATVPAAAACW